MNNDGREAILIPEKKEKIERIKRKYQNMELSDDAAQKIRTLEVVNNILISATGLVGVATVVNYFIPDALPFVDEAVMTGVTALLGSASTVVKNKINDLAATGTTEVKMEEVTKLSGELANVAQKIAEKKQVQAKAQ